MSDVYHTYESSPIGAVCGSVMLDVRFEELLRRIYQDEYSHEIPQGALNVACRYWQDYIKPTYRGPVDETEFAEMPYRVSLPGAAIKSAPSGFNRRFWSKESTIKSGTLGFDGGFWYMERYIRYFLVPLFRGKNSNLILVSK